MLLAFVIASKPDYQIARLCAGRLNEQGWFARIVVDPLEWEDRPEGSIWWHYSFGRGMYGNDVHEAILACLLENSKDGDTVAKFDCDIRLSNDGSEWLKDCSKSARCFSIPGHNEWGGCWSVKRDKVAQIAAASPAIPRCQCAESHLAVCGLRRFGGIVTHDVPAVMWRPGQSIPPNSPCVTLPRYLKKSRLWDGLALFDIRDGKE